MLIDDQEQATDTQDAEETIDAAEEETLESDDDEQGEIEDDESDDSEEGDEDISGAFDDDENEGVTHEPLADLKGLVKDNPAAFERVEQVEAGLLKLQQQKENIESIANPLFMILDGIEKGDTASIIRFEEALMEHAGVSYSALAELVESGASPETQRIIALEKRQAALETERVSAQWIETTGKVVARQVTREIGLEFPPELLWQVRPLLNKGSTVDQIRKAVMRTDPDAYDRAVSKRDGEGNTPVPRSATIPQGKGGATKTYDHTPQGFLKAYEAKRGRGGK